MKKNKKKTARFKKKDNRKKIRYNDDRYMEDYGFDGEEYYEPDGYYNEEYYEPDGYYNEEYYEEDGYYSEGYYEDGGYTDDYAEDTGSYYEDGYEEPYEDGGEYYEAEDCYEEDYYNNNGSYENNSYEDGYYENASYENASYDYEDEDSFDTAYGDYHGQPEHDEYLFGSDGQYSEGFGSRIKEWLRNMTVFDGIIASTGVVVIAAAVVIFVMFLQKEHIDRQIAALAPLGTELENIGIVGNNGLLAMADAALSGNFEETASSAQETSAAVETKTDEGQSVRVSVDFVSVEKDLKIRFTDAGTGRLITGTVFEVTLTNKKGKKLVLTDDDMDGVIYAQNVNAGVFEAVITSTDKYKFPTVGQQVTVKDKVEYVVINVQDEVKTEKQINVAQEDTQKNDAAAEAEVLKDTVEWVEPTKTPVSGTESYLLVDKNTIADPSKVSMAGVRMLFDALNVTLDKTGATLGVGESIDLKGTELPAATESGKEYKYTVEWKSSDDKVAAVNDGKVTAKAEGEAKITYNVIRETIKITHNTIKKEISEEKYNEGLAGNEASKYGTEEKDSVTVYTYTTEEETRTIESTDTASATCTITVKAAAITSGTLELSKSADSCAEGETLTVKPSKLVYKKKDGSSETKTDNFPTITWESSDKAVATVDEKGVVTGVKEGKAHITGKVTGVKGADGQDIGISCSVEVVITAKKDLTLTLDRTKDVTIAVGGSTTLVATVAGHKNDAGVTWETSDKKIATVDEKGVVTGVAAGSVKITAITKEKNAKGENVKAECAVTVNPNAAADTTTKLKDKNGNQIYIKNADGTYREAVYADYFVNDDFYIITQPQYAYTGWQTIDGKTYYYDKNGNVVTGTQIIQGVTYNFGEDGAIAAKANGSAFGIDVSRHNGKIDWNAVKASGVDYVIIRCGYRGSSTGVLIEDQNFKTNIKGATAAGLKVGVYVFSQAVNEVEAVKEASLAVSLVQGYNLAYPIFIDTESSGGRADKIDKATRTAAVNAFCQTVAGAGYKAGIYASKTWFEDKLNMGAVGNYRIWLAQYSSAPTYKGKYDMWQYSDKGKINGIKTAVDLNYSYLGY